MKTFQKTDSVIDRAAVVQRKGKPLSELANSVVIGIVAFLLLLATFWFVLETGQADPIQITHAQTEWAASDNGTPGLQVTLTFANPHAFEISLNEVAYAMDINDRRVSAGDATPSLQVPANGEQAVSIQIPLEDDFPVRWWADHAASGEQMEVQVAGEATFQVNQETRSVTFDESWSWDTDWIGQWDDDVANCPPADAALCVAESTHAWTTNGGLDSTLRFESQHNGTVMIDEVRATLLLEGHEVTSQTQRPAANLSEGDTAEVAMVLASDGTVLRAWWADHVAACEASDAAYEIEVTYTVASTTTVGTGNNTTEQVETRQETVPWTFPLPSFQTEIACEA